MSVGEPRPPVHEFKMAVAVEVASRSNCLKAHVGAILLQDDRIRAVGYNGTIEGYKDCFEGGCQRCRDLSIERGQHLDRCVCVHAEENAIASAARYGIEIGGTECFVTHEPCLSCTKLLIQAHVSRVVYLLRYQHPTTGDQNESRSDLRRHSQEKKQTIFEHYDEKDPRFTEWRDRLDDMKERALGYGIAAGIVINVPAE